MRRQIQSLAVGSPAREFASGFVDFLLGRGPRQF
jgi:hypothetical protein